MVCYKFSQLYNSDFLKIFPFKIREMGKCLQKHIAFFSDYKVFSNNLTGVSFKGISVDLRASFPCVAISASVYPGAFLSAVLVGKHYCRGELGAVRNCSGGRTAF